MKTLLLDTEIWDCVLDNQGNLAIASNPYALAQDAASTIRLFEGELWYDTTRGIPYFTQVLGEYPPLALMKSLIEEAAMAVPEVIAAKATITGFVDRQLTGNIHVTDRTGATISSRF